MEEIKEEKMYKVIMEIRDADEERFLSLNQDQYKLLKFLLEQDVFYDDIGLKFIFVDEENFKKL